MNREIKFRAWDKEEKKMLYNVIIGRGHWGHDLEKDTLNNNIMQFTGLKDKNGKEIYERDILKVVRPKFIEQIQIVEFKDSYFGVTTKTLYPDNSGTFLGISNFRMDNLSYTEIIGNIYENKELLK